MVCTSVSSLASAIFIFVSVSRAFRSSSSAFENSSRAVSSLAVRSEISFSASSRFLMPGCLSSCSRRSRYSSKASRYASFASTYRASVSTALSRPAPSNTYDKTASTILNCSFQNDRSRYAVYNSFSRSLKMTPGSSFKK